MGLRYLGLGLSCETLSLTVHGGRKRQRESRGSAEEIQAREGKGEM